MNITMNIKIYQNIPGYKCASSILIPKSQLCECWLLQITNMGTIHTIGRRTEIEPGYDCKYMFLYVAVLYGCWANKPISQCSKRKPFFFLMSEECWEFPISHISKSPSISCKKKSLKVKGKKPGPKKLELAICDQAEPRNYIHSHLQPVRILYFSVVCVIMFKASSPSHLQWGLHYLPSR